MMINIQLRDKTLYILKEEKQLIKLIKEKYEKGNIKIHPTKYIYRIHIPLWLYQLKCRDTLLKEFIEWIYVRKSMDLNNLQIDSNFKSNNTNVLLIIILIPALVYLLFWGHSGIWMKLFPIPIKTALNARICLGSGIVIHACKCSMTVYLYDLSVHLWHQGINATLNRNTIW